MTSRDTAGPALVAAPPNIIRTARGGDRPDGRGDRGDEDVAVLHVARARGRSRPRSSRSVRIRTIPVVAATAASLGSRGVVRIAGPRRSGRRGAWASPRVGQFPSMRTQARCRRLVDLGALYMRRTISSENVIGHRSQIAPPDESGTSMPCALPRNGATGPAANSRGHQERRLQPVTDHGASFPRRNEKPPDRGSREMPSTGGNQALPPSPTQAGVPGGSVRPRMKSAAAMRRDPGLWMIVSANAPRPQATNGPPFVEADHGARRPGRLDAGGFPDLEGLALEDRLGARKGVEGPYLAMQVGRVPIPVERRLRLLDLRRVGGAGGFLAAGARRSNRSSASTMAAAPRPASFSVSEPAVSVSRIGMRCSRSTGPVSRPASMAMIATPVSASPARIAR